MLYIYTYIWIYLLSACHLVLGRLLLWPLWVSQTRKHKCFRRTPASRTRKHTHTHTRISAQGNVGRSKPAKIQNRVKTGVFVWKRILAAANKSQKAGAFNRTCQKAIQTRVFRFSVHLGGPSQPKAHQSSQRDATGPPMGGQGHCKGSQRDPKDAKRETEAPQRTPGKSEVGPKEACRWPWMLKVARNVRKLEKTRQTHKIAWESTSTLEKTRENSRKLDTTINNSRKLEITRENSRKLKRTRESSRKLKKTREHYSRKCLGLKVTLRHSTLLPFTPRMYILGSTQVYIYIHTYISIYVFLCPYMSIYAICVCMCLNMYKSICIYICLHMPIYGYVIYSDI